MININLIKNKVPHFGKTEKGLFTFKELENLINLRPFCNDKRLISIKTQGHYIKQYSWHTDEITWPSSIIKKLLQKSSCYLADCSRASKKINNYAKNLEKIFNNPVDCHIYFSTTKNAEGFGKHNDVSQNVIVVCEGSINFKIYYNDKVLEKNLSNGDYAYIPDKIDHHLTPISKKRLSCSFPVSHHKNDILFEDRKWLTI
tara:strand:- start:456 stop:1058 length:603 start_codon:yes stop_codon:yes gene_type:complete